MSAPCAEPVCIGVTDAALLAALRERGLDSVAGAFAFAGGEDLGKPGLGHRRRTRLRVPDASGRPRELYLKRYRREPLLPAIRRCLRAGRWQGPGRAEFENIVAARFAGVPTMEPIVCGEEGWEGWPRRGYLIVGSVPGEAVERCGEAFFAEHGEDAEAMAAFTGALVKAVRAMHRAGYVHRDLYAAHVFLDREQGPGAVYLIDLARMFPPVSRRRKRWMCRDLGQLYYSMPRLWIRRCWDAFLLAYLDDPADVASWQREIVRRAESIRRRTVRRRRRGRERKTEAT